MIICLEGADATGKSTLARHLSECLGMPIVGSEGPPHYVGEINERLLRYAKLDNVIFDRHPAVSQPIYGKLRPLFPEPVSDILIERFYNSRPFFVYCDPPVIAYEHVRNTHDTDEHLRQISIHYHYLVGAYRAWSFSHANFMYRIGDDKDRVVAAIRGCLAPAAPAAFDQDIEEFHKKFGLEYKGPPRHLPMDLEFRVDFMQEELDEYRLSEDLHDNLDALVDLVYVAIGTAYLQGFNFREAWRRVHAANMLKSRATAASDSKRGSAYDVVKPPGWQKPDLTDLVSGA